MTDLTGKILGDVCTRKGQRSVDPADCNGGGHHPWNGHADTSRVRFAAVLAAPALLALGVPMLPAHLFIVYFASMSAITPPVAVAAFAAGSIARANPMAIGLLCCRLALVAFLIPFVFIYHPGLLLSGDVLTVAFDLVTAGLAVMALVAAAEGYALRPISLAWRGVFGAAGLLFDYDQDDPGSDRFRSARDRCFDIVEQRASGE